MTVLCSLLALVVGYAIGRAHARSKQDTRESPRQKNLWDVQ
jgi:hypothetical protein